MTDPNPNPFANPSKSEGIDWRQSGRLETGGRGSTANRRYYESGTSEVETHTGGGFSGLNLYLAMVPVISTYYAVSGTRNPCRTVATYPVSKGEHRNAQTPTRKLTLMAQSPESDSGSVHVPPTVTMAPTETPRALSVESMTNDEPDRGQSNGGD